MPLDGWQLICYTIEPTLGTTICWHGCYKKLSCFSIYLHWWPWFLISLLFSFVNRFEFLSKGHLCKIIYVVNTQTWCSSCIHNLLLAFCFSGLVIIRRGMSSNLFYVFFHRHNFGAASCALNCFQCTLVMSNVNITHWGSSYHSWLLSHRMARSSFL